jgi:uncharacterized protein (DUF885 family)
MKMIFPVLCMTLLFGAGSSLADYREDVHALVARVEAMTDDAAGLSDSQRFAELVQVSYDYSMLNFPEFATFQGDPRGQDRWTDQSEEAMLQRRADQKVFFAALQNIDRDALGDSERDSCPSTRWAGRSRTSPE